MDVSTLSSYELRLVMENLCKSEGVIFVHGSRKHKHPLQRLAEKAAALNDREAMYLQHFEIMGDRNSYSKTDYDGTFMRMKDDNMRNERLKAGYNIQLAVQSEHVLGVGVFPNPTDTKTRIPFLKALCNL